MRGGDGNESDKAVFGQILVEFKKQIVFDSIMVCDSALIIQLRKSQMNSAYKMDKSSTDDN